MKRSRFSEEQIVGGQVNIPSQSRERVLCQP